jgi:uncharacterized protein (TIGR00375 family)
MELIADFHLHTKYSAATSKNMDIDGLTFAAKVKGINILGTGDFTHPLWFSEIKEKLKFEDGLALYDGIYFMLTVEVSNVFSLNNKIYKIHNIILSPSIEICEQINERFSKRGNLKEDGRPTLNYSCAEMSEELKSISKDIAIIPAHIWTPWFSLFGSNFGADDIKEIFPYDDLIIALETGLSSDPPMNWMISKLDKYTLVSNSDAHSFENLGREANRINVKRISYKDIREGIKSGEAIIKTYEYFPQEGKYFNDGHRKCNVNISYKEAESFNNICPVCKKKLTIGVMHRIYNLADRAYGQKKPFYKPYQHIIPVKQVIAKTLNVSKESKKVLNVYNELIAHFGNEFAIHEADEKELMLYTKPEIAEALIKVKKEQVKWLPGYDGVFGDFSFNDKDIKRQSQGTLKGWFNEV